ncbi:citrate-binding protein-like [Tasmannia lanceolata]|uniref:citrate-binding protein-like n=1 Tax=Tasmannia lanceolata TaxID=3420 RepID=UPI00406311D4
MLRCTRKHHFSKARSNHLKGFGSEGSSGAAGIGSSKVFVGVLKEAHLVFSADPTDGFTNVPLTEWNFQLQKPYDKPLSQRYSYKNGVRRLWVYSDDKPLKPTSNTLPRTEIRIRGDDYSSGVWQFEGHGFVPNGTSAVSIIQIHGAAKGATTLQLRVYNGDIKYYRYDVVTRDVYDKWIRYNVIHNVDEGKVFVFINGIQKFEVKDQGPGDLYFKCGVYANINASFYMESRWKGIKIYKK